MPSATPRLWALASGGSPSTKPSLRSGDAAIQTRPLPGVVRGPRENLSSPGQNLVSFILLASTAIEVPMGASSLLLRHRYVRHGGSMKKMGLAGRFAVASAAAMIVLGTVLVRVETSQIRAR